MEPIKLKPADIDEMHALLDKVRADVDSGAVRSLLVVSIKGIRELHMGWSGFHTFYDQIGVLEVAKQTMIANTDDETCEPIT